MNTSKSQLILSVAGLLASVLILTACGGSSDAPIPTLVEIPAETISAPTAVSQVSTDIAITASPELATEALDPTQSIILETPGTLDTVEPDANATVTFTPSLTITNTSTPLPTATASNTAAPDPLDDLVALALQATILPQSYYGTPGAPIAIGVIPPTPDLAMTQAFTCAFTPPGGFGTLFASDPTLRQQIGCPLSAVVGTAPVNTVRAGALQIFQFGAMVWAEGTPSYIYVFYPNQTYHRYLDNFIDGIDPTSGGETPPAGNLFEPVRGFGKVWRTNPDVRASLGWATGGESAGTATTLDFDNGLLLYIDVRGDILVLARSTQESGTWRSAPGAP